MNNWEPIVSVIMPALNEGKYLDLVFDALDKIDYPKNKLEIFYFALILGGALGNLIDRIFIGSVTDFIWCDFPDIIMTRWPIFNIADSSIVIAMILMIASTLFHKDKYEEKE